MIKRISIALFASALTYCSLAQETKLEYRDSFVNFNRLRYGIGGHFSLLDYAGPQGDSYLLNSHSISGKKMLLWEPGVTFSYWRVLKGNIDLYVGLSGNSVNLPASSSDSLFLSERNLGKNYNVKPIGDLDARLVYNLNNKLQHRLSPYISAGAFLSVADRNLSVGVPAGLGLNVKIDQGIYFNIETNYRLALMGNNQTHLMHKVGLVFWSNQRKHVVTKRVAVVKEVSYNEAPKPEPNKPAKNTVAANEKTTQAVAVAQPDGDNDGVADAEDRCPGEKGKMKYFGCPTPDTDKDGINDDEDKCIREKGFAKYNGCPVPDTDGDGFNDENDACIDAPSYANGGCPK